MAQIAAYPKNTRREIQETYGTFIATNKCGAEMEVAVEVVMSSRMTLRKAVIEILKEAGSNSTVESQISEDAEKQHDQDTVQSSESRFKWMLYRNSYSL